MHMKMGPRSQKLLVSIPKGANHFARGTRMQNAQFARKVQGQIERFSGKLSAGLPKVARRAVREILYGMQARGSVRLSEIGRALEEETALKKVIERLGRQLGRAELRPRVREKLLVLGAPTVGEETLLVTDLTDISKPHAEEMEHLAKVRDGSTGEITDGYECAQVLAVEKGSAEVVPLYQELYSSVAPAFESENREILKAVRRVSEATGGQGTWVIDRGGDRRKIIEPLLEEDQDFLIRLQGDRHLKWSRSMVIARDLAARVRRRYEETVVKEETEEEKAYVLRFGSTPVRFPGVEQKLWLVVIDGLGKEPLLLLTTLPAGRSKKRNWGILQSYLTRWRVEETIRFIKQSYDMEDIRVLKYDRLRAMATLVMAAAYFTCMWLGRRTKLRVLHQHVLEVSQRIYGIPEFRFYAIADGIKELLFGRPGRLSTPDPPKPSPELTLFPMGP